MTPPFQSKADLLKLDAQVCFALYAASRAVTRAYVPLLEPLGITYPQYLVMLVLWEEGPASVKQIGERLELDSGTLTPLLKRLEQQGLLVRRRDERDGRVVTIELTRKGRAMKEKARAIPEKLACLMVDLDRSAGPERLRALRSELRTLTKRLGEGP